MTNHSGTDNNETLEAKAGDEVESSGPSIPSYEADRAISDSLEAAIATAEAAEGDGPDAGIKAWQEAWNADPGHPMILETLERLYSETEKWTALADFLKRGSRNISDPGKFVAAHMLLARIYDVHLQQDPLVVSAYQAIVKTYPDCVIALDACIEKYQAMERWPDLVKVLKSRAEIASSSSEAVEIWLQVASLFVNQFSNQAEAIKAFEHVIELEPGHPDAVDFLKEMYEKRRDWNRLLDLMAQQTERMEDDVEKAESLVEIARMASERVKKPDICIASWEAVLSVDSENQEALNELASFYERAREWEKLTGVLEKNARNTSDVEQQKDIFQKLGMVYGDKLSDDHRAIEAWKSFLELVPDDRRAQEQLKKRYLAIQAWDELEAFYADSDKWDELIRVLEREAGREELDVTVRVGLFFKIAELWRDKKERLDKSTAAYEEILSIDSENRDAAEALIPIYEASQSEPARLAAALNVRLTGIDDPDEQIALRRRIAGILEEHVADFSAAFEVYQQIFRMQKTDLQAQADLERTAGKAGRWNDVLNLYRTAYENASDALEKTEFRIQMARVMNEELGLVEEALAHFDDILSSDPKNAKAIYSLERIYAQMGRYEELLEIYAKRIEMAEDDEERKEILYNQALLWEEEIDDPSKAIAVYDKIIDIAGDERRALVSLDRIYTKREEWSEVVLLIDRQLAMGLEQVSEEIELKFRYGQILHRQLSRSDAAIRSYHDVLNLDPAHEPTIEAMESLLTDDQNSKAVAIILAPVYEDSAQWEGYVKVLGVLATASEDSADKYEMYMRIGDISAQQLDEPERSFTAYAEAFSAQPGLNSALEHLEELTLVMDKWETLVSLIEKGAARQNEPEVAAALWLKAAQIQDAQLDNVAASITDYRNALELNVHCVEAVEALENIYSREEKWSELTEILGIKVDSTADAESRQNIYRTMARIYEEMLERPEAAVDAMKEILNIDPSHLETLVTLDRLFVQLEKWTDLADVLQQQLGLESDGERLVDLKLRLAAVREIQLKETAAAVDIYKEVLELDVGNEVAVEALERIVQNSEHQKYVAEILEPIYRELGNWEKLIAVLEIAISYEEDTSRRVDVLHEIAASYETVGDDPDKAFATFSRALREEPDQERTQDELERMASMLSCYDQLADLYEEQIADLSDADLIVRFHMKIAVLCEETIQDTDRAIRHYRAVLHIDPIHLEAATALERAFQLTENYAELAAIYLKKAEMLTDMEEQKDILFRASQIYEDVLELPEKAISTYQQILEIDADELRALGQLEGLYLRLENWDELQNVYNIKVDLLMSPEDKKEVLYVLGAMYERELQDTTKAIVTYQRILEFDPDDLQSIQRLDILYAGTEAWPDLLSILEKEIELLDDPEEVVSYRYRIAELYVQHLDDSAQAIDYLKDILIVMPDHEPSVRLLENLLSGDEVPLLAAEVLEPIYQELGEWRKLVGLLNIKVEQAEDNWEKVELLHKAGELLESDLHLDSPGEAFEVYANAVTVDPLNSTTMERLESLAHTTNRWSDFAKLMDREIEGLEEEETKVALCLKAGVVYQERLENIEEAILRFQAVLSIEEDNLEALQRLDNLFQFAEKWEELSAILLKESAIVVELDDRLALLLRLGQLYQREMGRLDSAVDIYREILSAEPTYDRAISALEGLFSEKALRDQILEILEPLLQVQGEWSKLVGLYIADLEGMTGIEDRIPMQHRIAETFEDKLLDPVEAFRWYSKAFSEDPFDDRTATDVERLAQSIDAADELADLYEQQFALLEDIEAKKYVAKKLARVAEEELQDVARAERAFRGCLDLGDRDLDILHALDRIYTQYMEWERLVSILEMLAEVESVEDDQVTALFRMGDILESQLDETEKARILFCRIVDELEPGHTDALERLELIYANREDWQNLYHVYEKLRSVAANTVDESGHLAKMATIASACLKDPDKAIGLWKSVLDLLGEDSLALEMLSDLYTQQENWAELVDILERAVTIAEDDDARVRLYSQLGLVWGQCLKRDRNALENWQNVLSIDMENTTALRAIASIHEANQEWDELIETLERIIAVGASSLELSDLKSYYSQLARILSDVVERPRDAIEVWQNAFSMDPSDLSVLRELETLYISEELFEELVETLGRKAELLDGQEQVDTWMESARILEEQLERPRDAQSPYVRILTVCPVHDHAFERMIEILTGQQSWDELIQLYSVRLEHVADQSDQIGLLHNAAFLYENELKQSDNAFYVMQRAFVLDYANNETADHLERLASASGKWPELFAGCNQILASTTDAATQIELCLKMGHWYASIGNPEYAIQYFQQVLTLDSSNVPALRQMGDLYRAAKQWTELVEVLRRAVECESDEQIRKDILVDLGEILMEYLQDLPEARKVFKQALAIDPALDSALVALERMFKATENWEELIPILRRKIDVLDETQVDASISVRTRIAEIYENQLDELDAAVQEYRANIELDSGHMRSLKGLERLYEKQQQWQNLADVLEAQLDYVTAAGDRILLLSRIAQMNEEKFRRPEMAIERLEEVMAIDDKDIDALLSLERLYRYSASWGKLIETYERHVVATLDRKERIPLLEAMGSVFALEIKDPDRAMDAFQQILDIDPENENALDNLARQQVKAEDWVSAHETLNRLAETITDKEQRVDLYWRLGELNENHLNDRGAAIEHFRSALDIDTGHLDSLSALHQIYVNEAEWLPAAEIVEELQKYAVNSRQKSVYQFELGKLHKEKLDDENAAINWFERALESDDDNQNAAEPLVEVYLKAARWSDAERLLDMLVRLGGKRPAEEQLGLHSKLGRVADQLGKMEKAVKSFHVAHEMKPQDLSVLLDYADVLYRSREWDKAFKLYQMALVNHRDHLEKSMNVEIFYRLGRIKAELGERRKALNMFDKALEIDSDHIPSLESVIELQMEQKNYDQVIHFKKVLIDAVNDENRKFSLYEDIGDIWRENLKNPQKAISAYQEASDIDPDNRPILHKLMPLYQTTKQWQNVVDVVKRVCSMETNQTILAKLYYTIAVIYRDEIKSAEDAVECFNLALDNSLENLKAFEAIDKILTQQKDWKQLERNYRKMIRRLTGKSEHKDIEINLWHFLGEIYRTRMGQFEAAAESFKMASVLDPDNVTRHEILAELYSKMPDKLHEAVEQHLALIEKNPYKVDAYKALRRLYFEHRQYDRAWCLCATLAFLKKADPEEQQFFEQYRTRGTVRAQARMDNERWVKDLFHKEESIYIGKIFEIATRAVRSLKIQPIKNFGLKKNQKRPLNDTLTVSKTFYYAAQVLNLPIVPELYLQEDSPSGLNFAITEPMASACGSALLTGYSPQDLLFIVTKHLAYYRPEHYLRWVLPSHSELKQLMLACLKIGGMTIPDKDGIVAQWQRELEKVMTSMEIDSLRKVVSRFVKSGEQADLKKWIRCLELTACRAGFVMSNDLETATRMIQTETTAVDDLSPKEKIKELVLFSVSEEYFRLREALGIQIGT